MARKLTGLLLLLGVGYAALSVPDSDPVVPPPTGRTAFAWDQDAFWRGLEDRFRAIRAGGCEAATPAAAAATIRLERSLARIEAGDLAPDAEELRTLERELFDLAAHAAACSEQLPELVRQAERVRAHVKRLSIDWDVRDAAARERLYRSLYGARAALEEAMLQAPPGSLAPLLQATRVASRTPGAQIEGLAIHSGDLLVSRGGAPTSALIARGNDFPGNFSHVALVYVEPETGEAFAVEAHIEVGVAISSVQQYLADKKLRIMVLRARPDHPALRVDPMLPHAAARAAIDRVRREHVPYDFAMDFSDPKELFCSEVASQAYATRGLTLWMGLSHMSSPVLRTWLSGFSVRHFETQAPSDLEYDPALSVVAEWRDPEVLFQDHVDGAVIDAMLELASEPQPLPYDGFMLPAVRLLKAYSVLRNWLGGHGPVPEGMSATAALRSRAFTARHEEIKTRLLRRVARFQETQGYRPPYWALVRLAEESVADAE